MTRTEKLRSRAGEGRRAGLTFIEVTITVALLSIFLYGISAVVAGLQIAFVRTEVAAELTTRAHHTMDRLISTASQALTSDGAFTPIKPDTGVNSAGLEFRIIQSVASDGTVTYNDAQRVYIYGPSSGAQPNNGVIIGRGPSLATVHAVGAGVDTVLGTTDDNVNQLVGGIPYVELLLTDRHAPSTGTMLEIDVDDLLVTITLRVNAVGPTGDFVRANDLVLTERVALRQ